MAPFNGSPTHAQKVALALCPKVVAPFSIAGSSYIVWDCWRKRHKSRRNRSLRHSTGRNTGQTTQFTTYHRLMMGLSMCDILMSMGLFTTTWPMPIDTPNVWGAAGTVQSCEAIGFLEQWGVAATMYNGSLSIYYLLRIRYGWRPSSFAKHYHATECVLHSIPLLFAFATAVASLALDLFNSGLFDCWIAPFPQGCQESWRHRNDDGFISDCIRGNNASLYQWVFDVIPKWSSILLVTINMILTYWAVRRQEQATLRFSVTHSHSQFFTSNNGNNQRKRPLLAQRLARQSYFYVGALYLTYIPVIITRSTELAAGYVYYGMLLTISITLPLQGFWNGTYHPMFTPRHAA